MENETIIFVALRVCLGVMALAYFAMYPNIEDKQTKFFFSGCIFFAFSLVGYLQVLDAGTMALLLGLFFFQTATVVRSTTRRLQEQNITIRQYVQSERYSLGAAVIGLFLSLGVGYALNGIRENRMAIERQNSIKTQDAREFRRLSEAIYTWMEGEISRDSLGNAERKKIMKDVKEALDRIRVLEVVVSDVNYGNQLRQSMRTQGRKKRPRPNIVYDMVILPNRERPLPFIDNEL